MKEVYEKPGLFIENFKISQSIANGCFGTDYRPNHDQYSCPVEVPGTGMFDKPLILFADGPATSCKDYAVEGDNGICYHASQDNVYQS